MRNEDIRLSQKQLQVYHVLRCVLDDKVTLKEAAEAVGYSYRHLGRLLSEVEEHGAQGLIHGNRGRPPSNKTPDEMRARVVELSERKYTAFNDTHFTDMLTEREGMNISRETVRAIRRGEGIAPKRKRRVAGKHRKRRERRAAEGMMMLWDGSPHRWFGSEEKPCCAMAAIDDARGVLLALEFIKCESSEGYFRLLRAVVERYGIPTSVYQDRHGALKRNDDHWSLEEQLAGEQEPTQVGRALKALGIEAIDALSPQAKGRVERLFGTLQDRLCAMFELEGIKTIESANRYVKEVFIEDFNTKYAVPAKESVSVWRKAPRGLDLSRIISFQYRATVANDNAVRISGMVIDIPKGPHGRGYAGLKVDVHQLLDGSWRVYHGEELLATAAATEVREPLRARARRRDVPAAHDSFWVYPVDKKAEAFDPETPASVARGSACRYPSKSKGSGITARRIA
jgi:transposase